MIDALELLSGDAQTFVEKVWARQIHLHQAAPDDLTSLLSLDDVDHLITSTALRTPAMRMAKDGSVLPASSYTRSASLAGAPMTGLVDGRKVLDLFEGGATLVLQGLHRYWPAITQLVKALESELGHPCQANAYLTPPGSQGFAVHKDSHDVFVFQTAGRKRWEVHDASGARDIVMEPGVSMYLPTGTPHAARTEQSVSLHVTLGINQFTWRGVLERSVQTLLESGAYDDAVPAGYIGAPASYVEELVGRLKELADAIGKVDPSAEVARETERFLSSRPANLRGGLVDRLSLQLINDDTDLVRRPGAVCVVRHDADAIVLLLGDRTMRAPARLADAVEFIRTHPELRPSDLSELLDPQSRVVLTRRLVREGLLQVRS